MNNLNTRCLYAIEPLAQRLINGLSEAFRALVTFYWIVFKLWGHFFLGGIALVLILAGAKGLQNRPEHWYIAVPGIALGVAFFISCRVRQFAWTFFGLLFLWFILVSGVLLQFLDPAKPVPSWQLRACVIILYVLPPMIGAAIIHYATNRTVGRTDRSMQRPRHSLPSATSQNR